MVHVSQQPRSPQAILVSALMSCPDGCDVLCPPVTLPAACPPAQLTQCLSVYPHNWPMMAPLCFVCISVGSFMQTVEWDMLLFFAAMFVMIEASAGKRDGGRMVG